VTTPVFAKHGGSLPGGALGPAGLPLLHSDVVSQENASVCTTCSRVARSRSMSTRGTAKFKRLRHPHNAAMSTDTGCATRAGMNYKFVNTDRVEKVFCRSRRRQVRNRPLENALREAGRSLRAGSPAGGEIRRRAALRPPVGHLHAGRDVRGANCSRAPVRNDAPLRSSRPAGGGSSSSEKRPAPQREGRRTLVLVRSISRRRRTRSRRSSRRRRRTRSPGGRFRLWHRAITREVFEKFSTIVVIGARTSALTKRRVCSSPG